MSMPGAGEETAAQILIKLGEMGAQLAVISERIGTNATLIGDHETRLRKLEGSRWPLPTVTSMAAVGAAVGAWFAALHR